MPRNPVELKLDFVLASGQSGFVNMGNTCFLNAALNCLMHTHEFTVSYIITKDYLRDLNPKKKESVLAIGFHNIARAYWEEECIIEPCSFKEHLETFYRQYVGWRQHDSHEVLISILDTIHTATAIRAEVGYTVTGASEDLTALERLQILGIRAWANSFKDELSTVVNTFYGQYHYSTNCAHCGYSAHRFEPFSAVELPVNGQESLEGAMRAFTAGEVLDDANKWKCDRCRTETNAMKQVNIWRVPQVLIVTLKRFGQFPNGMSYKLHNRVDFPLSGFNVFSESTQTWVSYELYSVVYHMGGTEGGHYVAAAKHSDGRWYSHNDDSVREIFADRVVNEGAYILFYRRNP